VVATTIGRELTPRQRALVDALVATGCTITEAARAAGYSGGFGGDRARITASRTLRLPSVAEYLRRRMLDAFRLEAGQALATLRRLHTPGASEYFQCHAKKTSPRFSRRSPRRAQSGSRRRSPAEVLDLARSQTWSDPRRADQGSDSTT
jgi:phage terminase small subunit